MNLHCFGAGVLSLVLNPHDARAEPDASCRGAPIERVDIEAAVQQAPAISPGQPIWQQPAPQRAGKRRVATGKRHESDSLVLREDELPANARRCGITTDAAHQADHGLDETSYRRVIALNLLQILLEADAVEMAAL